MENENEVDPYHLTPEEARAWRQKIVGDPAHSYWNEKATTTQRNLAIKFVERLYDIEVGRKSTIAGYVDEFQKEEQALQRKQYGNALDGHLATGYDPIMEKREAERRAEEEAEAQKERDEYFS